MTTITLPWPDKRLSPNARVHWSKRYHASKWARREAWGLVKQAGRPLLPPGTIALSVVFCPPDGRRRDLDNCIASMKASFDGLAEGLGVDDSRFRPTFHFAPSEGKPGKVLVTIGETGE